MSKRSVKIVVKYEDGLCEVQVGVPSAIDFVAASAAIVNGLYSSMDEHDDGPIIKAIFRGLLESGDLFKMAEKHIEEKHTCKTEEEAEAVRKKLKARSALLDIMEQINANQKEEAKNE